MAAPKLRLSNGVGTKSGNVYKVPIYLYYTGNGQTYSNVPKTWTISGANSTLTGTATYTVSTSEVLLASGTLTFTLGRTSAVKTIKATLATGSYYGTLSTSTSITIPAGITQSTIHFRGNNGEGIMDDLVYTNADSGTVNLTLNTFTRTGYTFLGWSKSSSATVATYIDGQAWNLSNLEADYYLYAVWKINSYSVVANLDSGDIISIDSSWSVSSNQAQKLVVYGSTLGELPVVAKTGYDFIQWEDLSGNVVTKDTVVTESLSIIAKYNQTLFSLTYAYNYLPAKDVPASQIDIEYNTAVQISSDVLEAPTVSYDFIAWNTESDGSGTTYNPGDNIVITKDVILYAIWKKVNYNIHLLYINNNEVADYAYLVGRGTSDTLSNYVSTYNKYISSGYFQPLSSSLDNINQFITTDLYNDDFSDYTDSYSNIQSDLYFATIYKINNIQSNQTVYIKSTIIRSEDGDYFNTLAEKLTTPSGETDIENANTDDGTNVYGYIKLNSPYASTDTLHSLTSNLTNLVGVRDGKLIVTYLENNTTKSTTATVGTLFEDSIIYIYFKLNDTFINTTAYTFSIQLADWISDYELPTNNYTVDLSIAQSIILLDINKNASMLSIGGASVDVGSKFIEDIEWSNTDLGILIQTPIYTSSSTEESWGDIGKYKTMMTNGILEDNTILSKATIEVWTNILQ